MPESRIMYIQDGGGLARAGRIGRVTFSKSGKTLYYQGREFQSLSGQGYKANYFDVESGEHSWISGCRKDGNDSLYPGVIEVDDDVREEYWTTIRDMPECVELTSFRAPGKYTKGGKVDE